MATGRRGGVNQLSAHYVEWSLHSDDCVCDCCPNKYLLLHLSSNPGVAECQKMAHPSLCYTLDRILFLYLLSFTAHPSFTYFADLDLNELITLFLSSHLLLLYLSLCL